MFMYSGILFPSLKCSFPHMDLALFPLSLFLERVVQIFTAHTIFKLHFQMADTSLQKTKDFLLTIKQNYFTISNSFSIDSRQSHFLK